MNEHILTFGPGSRLVGTLTRPSGVARCTAVLLLNAGVVPRMGPHRINVKLARKLAELGFTVLRLDLSGLGDSEASDEGLSFERQAVVDLQAAMDHLQRVAQVRSFALAGICSGAHHGMAAALHDDRLQALWLMDTHAYPTPRARWVRARKQLQIDLGGTLARWALKAVQIPASRARTDQARLDDNNPYPTPAKAEFAHVIQALLDRQVRLQFVYTGGMFWQHNHASQWRNAFRDFGAVAQVPCDLLPDVDHTASTLHAQQRLLASVVQFMSPLP
nr:alpha/beta fold hydrolase [uncultured Aquabacterium sp.]